MTATRVHNIYGISGALAFVALLFCLLFISVQSAFAAPAFTKDLEQGSEGDEVVLLQNFLEEKGFLVMPPGVAKGFFGARTARALAQYQASVKINPASGYFGPVTRGRIISEYVKTADSTQGPVVTDIEVVDAKSVIITGRGFSTSIIAGTMNTVMIGNSSSTKLMALTNIPSANNGTRIEIQIPVYWLAGEQPIASVKNDLTRQVSPVYPYPPTNVSGGGPANQPNSGANPRASTTPTPSQPPITSPGVSYNPEKNLANLWSAIQVFFNR